MTYVDRITVWGTMLGQGLVPVFYHPDPEVARGVAGACADGGGRLLEFTNRGVQAIDVFADLYRFCAKRHPEMLIGAGSVVDAPTAGQFINAGARFVVGPMLNAEVARVCNRRKIAYVPGCGSASEISAAEELGCEIVKMFPGAQVGGPAFVKAMLGPCPWTRIMPTGGVSPTEESLRAWFSAGAACVGIGSELLAKHLVEASDYPAIAERVRSTLALIREIREKS
jgi:2-dehydro-3-deoxyphosphogluconate aldolase / (4S)-4-hydroxy-2-oxoglutarate aldolase